MKFVISTTTVDALNTKDDGESLDKFFNETK